jgi:hypothetical protein
VLFTTKTYQIEENGGGQGMVETRNAKNILLATTRMKWPFATIKRGWNGSTKRKEL